MKSKCKRVISVAICIGTVVTCFHHIAVARDRDPIRLTPGPMLGHVTADLVRDWGRTSDPGQFVVRFGLEADKHDQSSKPATTKIENDNTGFTTLTGLQPDTSYHYQVWVNDRPHGLPGTFRTLPSTEFSQNPEFNPKGLFNFRFEIGSCANQNPLHGVGHRPPVDEHLNRNWTDKVHFHINNGDWLYEELREHPPEAWRLTQGIDQLPCSVQVMPTLVGVWENYELYLSRGNELANWHTRNPSRWIMEADSGFRISDVRFLMPDVGS